LQKLEKDPDKLAEDIGSLDQRQIIMVSLIDEVGEILGFYLNQAYCAQYSSDRKKYGMIAARLSVGFGAALATDKDGMVSETEAVAIIRKNAIHYYTRIPGTRTPTIVAIWFNRKNTDVSVLSERIRAYFA
jgi:hypothetical protein